MATVTTFDKTAGNLVRDVDEVIRQISPEETPAFTTAQKASCDATLYEFQEDALASANADNAQVQGFTPSYTVPTDVTINSNRTQIFSATASVAGTAEAVNKYGIASQLAYNISQRGKELKRDIEAAMVGRDQAAVTGSTSTAAKMASVINQIDSSVTVATAAGGVLTEAAILSAHEACFTEGADPSLLMTHPSHAQTIAGFATAAGRQRDFASSTELVASIDLIVSPFGELSVVLNRFASTGHVLLVDPQYLEVATLRPFTTTRMAKTSDSEEVMLTTELTCAVKHSKGHGMVTITA